jgi:hypothetical protein
MITHEGNDTPGTSRRKKREEVQQLSIASEETTSDSPRGGGDDEVDKEENNGQEDQQKQGEVTPPQNPPEDAEPSHKRKFSPTKPTSRKKSKGSKTKLQTMLTLDDFNFIIAAISDTSKYLLQRMKLRKRPCMIKLKRNCEGCNGPFTPAAQCPLCPLY